jgi:hypothetical protein
MLGPVVVAGPSFLLVFSGTQNAAVGEDACTAGIAVVTVLVRSCVTVVLSCFGVLRPKVGKSLRSVCGGLLAAKPFGAPASFFTSQRF